MVSKALLNEKADPFELGGEGAAEMAIWGVMIGAALDVAVGLVSGGINAVSLIQALTGPFAIFFTALGAAVGYFRGRRLAREINSS
jgi:hypothetical protein